MSAFDSARRRFVSAVLQVGRQVPEWLRAGITTAWWKAAALGDGVRLTLTVAGGVARTIFLDPWVTTWEIVSHATKQLYARASQTWPRYMSIIS